MTLPSVPTLSDAVVTEVDPRIRSTIRALEGALDGRIEYGDALHAALGLIVAASGWLVVSQAMDERR